MSFLEKSQHTYIAASHLKDFGEQFIPTCVHCHYYACLHLILYVLEDTFELYKSARDKEANEKGLKSHEYLLFKIKEYMKHCKADDLTLKNFTSNFGEVKLARKKADYSNLTIEIEEYESIEIYSNKVLETIYNTFKI